MFVQQQHAHFIGIGGIGMSGIAEILLSMGTHVSGSDQRRSAITDRLAALGATVFEGHRSENIAGATVVVTSSAIRPDNPEVMEARQRKIPVIQRAEMLAELMRLKYGIAIAGMHGKTTTTSMVASVLSAGGLDPTVVVGGRVDALGSNARLGSTQYLVAEADESDRSFLKLSPILAVITNLDREHMDCYHDMADVESAFLAFMDKVPFYGAITACVDNPALAAILPRAHRRVFTYGLDRSADYRLELLPSPRSFSKQITAGPLTRSVDETALTTHEATRLTHEAASLADESAMPADEATPASAPASASPTVLGASESPLVSTPIAYSRFQIWTDTGLLGPFELHVPGHHNVLNATAAIAIAHQLSVAPEKIVEGIANFRGVDRRFQYRGSARGIAVIDDYGHHPTEIRATLAAALECGHKRIHVLFQPHRYSRTLDLLEQFEGAFQVADSLTLLPIYAASETPIPGVTAKMLAERMRTGGQAPPVTLVEDFPSAVAQMVAQAEPGDLILTLGAGNVSQLAPLILKALEQSVIA